MELLRYLSCFLVLVVLVVGDDDDELLNLYKKAILEAEENAHNYTVRSDSSSFKPTSDNIHGRLIHFCFRYCIFAHYLCNCVIKNSVDLEQNWIF